jgi:hypothetical protein
MHREMKLKRLTGNLSVKFHPDNYAEDIYNGNKCFKETITLQKMTYSDNRSRWTITKIKRIEAVTCNGDQ